MNFAFALAELRSDRGGGEAASQANSKRLGMANAEAEMDDTDMIHRSRLLRRGSPNDKDDGCGTASSSKIVRESIDNRTTSQDALRKRRSRRKNGSMVAMLLLVSLLSMTAGRAEAAAPPSETRTGGEVIGLDMIDVNPKLGPVSGGTPVKINYASNYMVCPCCVYLGPEGKWNNMVAATPGEAYDRNRANHTLLFSSPPLAPTPIALNDTDDTNSTSLYWHGTFLPVHLHVAAPGHFPLLDEYTQSNGDELAGMSPLNILGLPTQTSQPPWGEGPPATSYEFTYYNETELQIASLSPPSGPIGTPGFTTSVALTGSDAAALPPSAVDPVCYMDDVVSGPGVFVVEEGVAKVTCPVPVSSIIGTKLLTLSLNGGHDKLLNSVTFTYLACCDIVPGTSEYETHLFATDDMDAVQAAHPGFHALGSFYGSSVGVYDSFIGSYGFEAPADGGVYGLPVGYWGFYGVDYTGSANVTPSPAPDYEDSSLASLVVTSPNASHVAGQSFAMRPVFSPDRVKYFVGVLSDVDEIHINATAADSLAKVNGANGSKSLALNMTTVTSPGHTVADFNVTSRLGARSTTYSVTIAATNDPGMCALSVVDPVDGGTTAVELATLAGSTNASSFFNVTSSTPSTTLLPVGCSNETIFTMENISGGGNQSTVYVRSGTESAPILLDACGLNTINITANFAGLLTAYTFNVFKAAPEDQADVVNVTTENPDNSIAYIATPTHPIVNGVFYIRGSSDSGLEVSTDPVNLLLKLTPAVTAGGMTWFPENFTNPDTDPSVMFFNRKYYSPQQEVLPPDHPFVTAGVTNGTANLLQNEGKPVTGPLPVNDVNPTYASPNATLVSVDVEDCSARVKRNSVYVQRLRSVTALKSIDYGYDHDGLANTTMVSASLPIADPTDTNHELLVTDAMLDGRANLSYVLRPQTVDPNATVLVTNSTGGNVMGETMKETMPLSSLFSSPYVHHKLADQISAFSSLFSPDVYHFQVTPFAAMQGQLPAHYRVGVRKALKPMLQSFNVTPVPAADLLSDPAGSVLLGAAQDLFLVNGTLSAFGMNILEYAQLEGTEGADRTYSLPGIQVSREVSTLAMALGTTDPRGEVTVDGVPVCNRTVVENKYLLSVSPAMGLCFNQTIAYPVVKTTVNGNTNTLTYDPTARVDLPFGRTPVVVVSETLDAGGSTATYNLEVTRARGTVSRLYEVNVTLYDYYDGNETSTQTASLQNIPGGVNDTTVYSLLAQSMAYNHVRLDVSAYDSLATVNLFRGNRRDTDDYTPLSNFGSRDVVESRTTSFVVELPPGDSFLTLRSVSHDGTTSESYVVIALRRLVPAELMSGSFQLGVLQTDASIPPVAVTPTTSAIVTEYETLVPNAMLPAPVAAVLPVNYSASFYGQEGYSMNFLSLNTTSKTMSSTIPAFTLSSALVSPLYVYGGFGQDLARKHLHRNLVKVEVADNANAFRANYTIAVRRQGNTNSDLKSIVVYTSTHGDYTVLPGSIPAYEESYATFVLPHEQSVHVVATAVASGRAGYDILSGADVLVRGRGNGAGSRSVGSVDAVIGMRANGLATDSLKPGRHTVEILVTSESGDNTTSVGLALNVLGEDPVVVSAKVTGVDYDAFMEAGVSAQDALTQSICTSLGIARDQMTNVRFSRGSVVVHFDAYPVVNVDRAMTATPEEDAAADASARDASYVASVALFNEAQKAVLFVPDLGLPPGKQILGQPAAVTGVVAPPLPEGVAATDLPLNFQCKPGYSVNLVPDTGTVGCAANFPVEGMTPALAASLQAASAAGGGLPIALPNTNASKKKKKDLPVGVIIAIVAGAFFLFLIIIALIAMAAEEASKSSARVAAGGGASGGSAASRAAAYKLYGYDDDALSPYETPGPQTSGQSIAGVAGSPRRESVRSGHEDVFGGVDGDDEDVEAADDDVIHDDEDDYNGDAAGRDFAASPARWRPGGGRGVAGEFGDEDASPSRDLESIRYAEGLRRSPSSRMYVVNRAVAPAYGGTNPAGMPSRMTTPLQSPGAGAGGSTREATLRRLADSSHYVV